MLRSSILVPLLGVLLLGGCSSTVAGSPAPGADSRPTATDTTTTESSPETAGSETRGLDPCESFTPQSLAPIGGDIQPGQEQDLLDARGCIWHNNAMNGVAIAAVIWDEQGLADAEGTPGQTAGRATKENWDGVMCWVSIGVADTSRVDVIGLGTAEADSCPAARQAATILAPTLPE